MKIISFYLPQFHQIPENDEWWGEGFTEWTNTKKTANLYKGHNQPREPLKDYYYDLTDPSARKWQADIAKEHGVYGFCYYHYWFKGKRLLEKPFDAVLNSGTPDFPFCLAWANEPWTRSWDGNNKEVIMPQDYGDEADWIEHFNYLLKAFKDPRYIRINDRPIFTIYRPSSITNCDEMLNFWNELAKENGLKGIHFVQMLTSFDNKKVSDNFSSQLEFEPMYTLRHHMNINEKYSRKIRNALRKIFNKFNFHPNWLLNKVKYDLVWRRIINRKREDNSHTFLGAFVDWDNTPRKGREGLIMEGSTPEKFEKYLSLQIKKSKENNSDYLFINAWNEWAEGTYLEPDKKNDYNYLRAIKRAQEN